MRPMEKNTTIWQGYIADSIGSMKISGIPFLENIEYED